MGWEIFLHSSAKNFHQIISPFANQALLHLIQQRLDDIQVGRLTWAIA